jgi:hypothetical protein
MDPTPRKAAFTALAKVRPACCRPVVDCLASSSIVPLFFFRQSYSATLKPNYGREIKSYTDGFRASLVRRRRRRRRRRARGGGKRGLRASPS